MQISDWLSKCKIFRVKSFCALLFLVVFELAAVSGRTNSIQTLGNSLNMEGEWQFTSSEIRESGEKMEPAYVKGFLVEALINAMPLRETNAVVDRLLPAICREL